MSLLLLYILCHQIGENNNNFYFYIYNILLCYQIGDMFKYVLKMTPWVLDIIGKVKVTSVFTYEEPFNFTHS